jgi:hypothetical protein
MGVFVLDFFKIDFYSVLFCIKNFLIKALNEKSVEIIFFQKKI